MLEDSTADSAAPIFDTAGLAAGLEVTPELLPLVPDLLQDIDELGGMFHHALPMLRALDLPRHTHVLDLGCGKGAIACMLAREFGWHVHGIEWFAPFVADAQARAGRIGVRELCSFECADARAAVARRLTCDVLVMFSVERFFGSLWDYVGAARRLVRPDGCMVLEEMFLAPGISPSAELGDYADEAVTRRALLSHGDRLLAWLPCAPDEFAAWNNWAVAMIENRARELIAVHPEHAAALHDYAEFQERESRRLERYFRTVTVILQRA